MKRAVSINGITFNYPLFVSEEYEDNNYIGSSNITTSCTLVIKQIEKGDLTKKVALYSNENAWVKTDIKNKLFKDINTEQKTVEFNDNSNETYYYDLSNPMEAEPLYEGADWYKIKINLLKGI